MIGYNFSVCSRFVIFFLRRVIFEPYSGYWHRHEWILATYMAAWAGIQPFIRSESIAEYFLRLCASATRPNSTLTFLFDLRRKRLKPWLDLMSPKTASGSMGRLLRCIIPRSLVSSSLARFLKESDRWLTFMVLQSMTEL